MSCEVKYIKENYSQHPDYQRLTDTYHAGMKELVSSKLFEEKNDKLKWAKEGTSSRIKQNKLAQSVENQYNVLVQENKGNVVVNISPLINQNNNSSEIKPGVEEVFNSSPELANEVYEVAGLRMLSENEVTIEEIGKDRFKITAINKTWKNIAQGREKNMSSLEDNSFKIQELIKSINEKGYDKTQENKSGSNIIGSKYRDNFLDLKDGKHRAVALGILFPNETRTIEFTNNNNLTWDKKDVVNSLKDSNIFLKQVTEKQITPQQKQQALQLYSQYLDTIFPDSKVKDVVYRGFNKDVKNSRTGTKIGIWFNDNKDIADAYTIPHDSYSIQGKILYSLNYKNFKSFFNKEGIFIGSIKDAKMAFREAIELMDEYFDKNDDNKVIFLLESYYKVGKDSENNIEQVLINIQNPKIIEGTNDVFETEEKLKIENNDSFIIYNFKGANGNLQGTNYVVFETEQIHILGSKQDVEGFKEFVNSQTQLQQPSKLTEEGKSLFNSTFNKVDNNKSIVYANYLADGEIALKNILDTISRLHIYENYRSENRLKELSKKQSPKKTLQIEIQRYLDQGLSIEDIYNKKVKEVKDKIKSLKDTLDLLKENKSSKGYIFASLLLGNSAENEAKNLIEYYNHLLEQFLKGGVELFENLIEEKEYSIYGDISEEIIDLLEQEKLSDLSKYYRNLLNKQIKEIKENFFIGELSKKGNPTDRNIFNNLTDSFIENFILEGQESITVQILKDLSNETSINHKSQNLTRELERRLDILKNKKNGHYLMTILNLKEYNEKLKALPVNLKENVSKTEQIHILGSKQDIEGFKEFVNSQTQFQKAQNIEGEYNETVSPFEKMTYEEQQAFELSIRDLSARIADRIGMTYQIENNKSEKYKGKIKNNVAYINLAYATLDTPIHEILGHPIIRAIKGKYPLTNEYVQSEIDITKKLLNKEITREEANRLKEKRDNPIYSELYKNLLKELEYGKGAEVLNRIKRDYNYKYNIEKTNSEYGDYKIKSSETGARYFDTKEEAEKALVDYAGIKYTLEEQQEEAIVELLGLMTAEKLDNVKDGKLISLLKRLLKEMKQFVRSLLNQKEVEIDKLPDNMTIGDLADILAYSNSKLILPGHEVVYTTPDNQQFKTYQEASNHISELSKSVKDVDLSNVDLPIINKAITNINDIPVNEFYSDMGNLIKKEDNKWVEFTEGGNWVLDDRQVLLEYNNVNELAKDLSDRTGINSFLEKNKEYEQSKEIIEEWKKVNNIQYNPEEIYSRGQEFSSVVGAYSDFDVNLMLQNLLSHIEDNEKAGGQFAISAYTKPIDKKINHLEGGSKIKFKLYPKSEDILWASNIDVYSGSVWDASAKVNKDKKSELLGVSYTKYPSLDNINSVQPNLAAIVDDLQHYHNELGIVLTGSNFRLEYDEYIPYSTKKIINSINSILDQKYGKLVKPEIKKAERKQVGYSLILDFNDGEISIIKEFKNKEDADKALLEERKKQTLEDINSGYEIKVLPKIEQGIQPTQTNETLKESIDNVKNKYSTNLGEKYLDTLEVRYYTDYYDDMSLEGFVIANYGNSPILNELLSKEPIFNTEEDANNRIKELIKQAEEIYNDRKNNQKEYTSQALINTKIAVLKEIAKSYPLSLIRSEVRKSNTSSSQELSDQFDFQKIQEENELGLAPLEIKKCK